MYTVSKWLTKMLNFQQQLWDYSCCDFDHSNLT